MTAKSSEGDDVDQSIAAWKAALPGHDVRAFEVALRIQRVGLLGRRNLAHRLPPIGVKPGDAEIVAILFEAGAPFRMQPSKLAERCLITTGAMTGRTNRLEKAGLLRRVPSLRDRRVMEVELTPAGRDLAVSMMGALLESAFTKAISALGSKESTSLSNLLRRLERNMNGNSAD